MYKVRETLRSLAAARRHASPRFCLAPLSIKDILRPLRENHGARLLCVGGVEWPVQLQKFWKHFFN